MAHPELTLQFLGGAETVTGSKMLLTYRDSRILIDCGMFQGLKHLRKMNWEPLAFNPENLDAVLLTHAHLDHCGYLPVLTKNGFKGPIYCTAPTQQLSQIILLDSAKIQEEEAERANRYGYTRHKPAKPLYTRSDATRCVKQLVVHPVHQWMNLAEGLRFRFHHSGHILGSVFVELKVGDKKMVFSGDLGRNDPLLLPPADPLPKTDFVVMESTYGDRLHPPEDPKEVIHQIVEQTWDRGGILMIPTFAVERAQELLILLSELKEEGRLPYDKVFLDSPMGVSATEVMLDFPEWHDLSREKCQQLTEMVDLITDAKTSKAIVADPRPKIVLAGSGMITGGRILHYLSRYLGEERHTVLLVGFQAAGTRGRALINGAHELKFFGQYHPVKAHVHKINSLSAHADQRELLNWLESTEEAPQYFFLNHGEMHQSDALRLKIQDYFGWEGTVARMDKVYDLSEERIVS